MEEIRCINRKRNKVGYFSRELVNNAYWRKQTGWERQDAAAEQPEQTPVPQPDELHALPVKRKGGRPKKNQQPA